MLTLNKLRRSVRELLKLRDEGEVRLRDRNQVTIDDFSGGLSATMAQLQHEMSNYLDASTYGNWTFDTTGCEHPRVLLTSTDISYNNFTCQDCGERLMRPRGNHWSAPYNEEEDYRLL